jgi:DNA-binding transcriptional LysR family regulator
VIVPDALTALAGETNLRVECVELEPEVSLPLLARGEIDLVIGQEYEQVPRPHHAGISRTDEASETVLLALPGGDPVGASGRPVALRALAGRVWATGQEHTAYAQAVVHACRSAGFEPDIRYRSNDVTVFLSLVAGGHAVALVPALALIPPTRGDVTLHEVEDVQLTRRLFTAVRRGDGRRPALARVRRAVRHAIAENASRAFARHEFP